MIKNFFWLIGAILIIFDNKLKKKSFMYEKVILWEKDM
jgi:hypothetical protein